MKYSVLVLCLVLLLEVPAVSIATPIGTAVSDITNNNAKFSATGGAGSAWFQYGMDPSTLNVWTPAQSTGGGLYIWIETGSPLTSEETYYVAGCDSTGCDPNPVSFTLPAASPLPSTTFGFFVTNATQNKFNLLIMAGDLVLPYTWLFPSSAKGLAISIITALVLFAIYYGYAARTRGTAITVILGLLGAPYLLYQNQGLNLGIPVEFQGIAQGIFYASVAGLVLIILRK
jgi:hypothetical protein